MSDTDDGDGCCGTDGGTGADPETGEATPPTGRARRDAIRDQYGETATETASEATCGDASGSSCCEPTTDADDLAALTDRLGYDDAALAAVPEGANLGLGCGNPLAAADLARGETVLDLGAGAGFDCFLAAEDVGETGRVIGVDMTPEMVETARENAAEADTGAVEFRLGEIEHLPVGDGRVDVVISNCVVNLSDAKEQVFAEAYRALRPGGRLALSDMVLTAPLPEGVRADVDAVVACVAGAAPIDRLRDLLTEAGFVDVAVEPKPGDEAFVREWLSGADPSDYVRSATITGRKPA